LLRRRNTTAAKHPAGHGGHPAAKAFLVARARPRSTVAETGVFVALNVGEADVHAGETEVTLADLQQTFPRL
jgi:hypothetical protein